eukprot:TRINITY_DN5516_c0_g1_i4.p1 TRINITY_DN5516_c0_g1~~TRINITY_DN5516_c0_g1_i4.p1  ORF type:complete len:241 (+),score=11.00 TRINITY_DN5516_c0_g1_i4:46-768(+)
MEASPEESIEVKLDGESPPPLPKNSRLSLLKQRAHDYFISRPFHRLVKHTIAVVISILFVLVIPVATRVENGGVMVALAVILGDFNKTIGMSLQYTLQMGLAIGLAIGILALAAVICSGNAWGLQAFLFLAMIFYNYIRVKSPDWSAVIITTDIMLLFGILHIYQYGTDVSTAVHYAVILGYNFLIGAVILLLVDLCILPKTTPQLLRSEMEATLKNVESVLLLSWRHFQGKLSEEESKQ